MSADAPGISVIVPAHNAEAHLSECLDSVIDQSFTDWELLIADDGSTDSTRDIAERFALADSRIRVLRLEQNSGASAARNACIDLARGRYLAFVDADDRLEHEYLNELISHAQISNADIVQCSFFFAYEDGSRASDPYASDKEYSGAGEIMDGFFTGPVGEIRVSVWAKLFRRESFRDIRFDTSLRIYEDAFYTYQCCRKAEKVSSFSSPLYLYCQHGRSVMHTGLAGYFNDYLAVFDRQQKDMADDRRITMAIIRRRAETLLWLMHTLVHSLRENDLWSLRKNALKGYGRVLSSSAPQLLKIKLTSLALTPHLYFAMLRRNYGRSDLFNIALKGALFVLADAGSFLLMWLLLRINVFISAGVSVLIASSMILLFSCLLRYTGFYYGYYSFISGMLFRKKTGAVYCPCCGKYHDSFRDEQFYADTAHFDPEVFRKPRQDVICRCCRSAPRHRIIAEWADKNIELLKNSKILYFAPELSMMLWFRRNGIHPVTADLYDRRTDLKLDLTALDLPDCSQDVIFCNHVLEHVSDHRKALSELHRVLRERGTLIISFPIDINAPGMREDMNCTAEERVKKFGQHDHLRVFGQDSLKMLGDAGFEVSAIDISNMPDNILPVTGPADYDSSTIFCCIRK